MVTNDVETLSPSSPLLYAHILNVKGRVLFDTLIYYKSDEELLIEVSINVKLSNLKKRIVLQSIYF